MKSLGLNRSIDRGLVPHAGSGATDKIPNCGLGEHHPAHNKVTVEHRTMNQFSDSSHLD